MVASGARGLSKSQRDEASDKLNKKIEKFVEAMDENPDQVPTRDMLQSHFSAHDLQALWKRLEKERGRQPKTIEEAWQTLKELGSHKAGEERVKTLAMYIKGQRTGQTMLWADNLLSIRDELKRAHIQRKLSRPMYRGELEQIHGKAEIAKFIRQGKWREGKDKDGDIVYYKVSREEETMKSRSQTVRGDRSATTTTTTSSKRLHSFG